MRREFTSSVGKRKNCETYAFQLVAKLAGCAHDAVVVARRRRRRSAVQFSVASGAHRVMIFREVDRKNENSSRCLGPLCRGYAEARYELLLRRVTEESVTVPVCSKSPAYSRSGAFMNFLQGRSSQRKYAAESRSLATKRFLRDTSRVCERRSLASLPRRERRI